MKLWLEHLAKVVRNRKRGAAKAAATKKVISNSTNQTTSTAEQPVRDEGYCGVDYSSELYS